MYAEWLYQHTSSDRQHEEWSHSSKNWVYRPLSGSRWIGLFYSTSTSWLLSWYPCLYHRFQAISLKLPFHVSRILTLLCWAERRQEKALTLHFQHRVGNNLWALGSRSMAHSWREVWTPSKSSQVLVIRVVLHLHPLQATHGAVTCQNNIMVHHAASVIV